MDRKNLARSFLVATVVAALSLQSTWIVIKEDLAGVVNTINRSGTVTMPILEPMIGINLIATLALFLLPRWAQRATLQLAAITAATALFMTVGWTLNHDLRLAPIGAIVASLASLYLGIRGSFSPLDTPRGPKAANQPDRWRALDEGIDPTLED